MKKISKQKLQLKRVSMAAIGATFGGTEEGAESNSDAIPSKQKINGVCDVGGKYLACGDGGGGDGGDFMDVRSPEAISVDCQWITQNCM